MKDVKELYGWRNAYPAEAEFFKKQGKVNKVSCIVVGLLWAVILFVEIGGTLIHHITKYNEIYIDFNMIFMLVVSIVIWILLGVQVKRGSNLCNGDYEVLPCMMTETKKLSNLWVRHARKYRCRVVTERNEYCSTWFTPTDLAVKNFNKGERAVMMIVKFPNGKTELYSNDKKK